MNKDVIDKIKFVLVGTTHPGNIGATARAMKTMGLERLALVNPKIYPDAEATARASGADDILANATVFSSLEEAINDCHFIFGTSTRNRSIPWPLYEPADAAAQLRSEVNSESTVALVFGRESSGLANEELELCNAMIVFLAITDSPTQGTLSLVSLYCSQE